VRAESPRWAASPSSAPGPGGLAAAADLRTAGAEVTVFEALHVVGGVLRYGIPSFRLPRDIIDREVKRLRDGRALRDEQGDRQDLHLAQLTGEMGYDAVFVAAGAPARRPSWASRASRRPGAVGQRVPHPRQPDGRRPVPLPRHPTGLGRDVIVIGAGNTAMDCLRVARRLGAERCAASTAAPRPRPRRASRSCATRARRASSSLPARPVEDPARRGRQRARPAGAAKMALGEPDDAGGAPVPTGEFFDAGTATR
jgi:glutamate synthase (NADPH/NADH) small chain